MATIQKEKKKKMQITSVGDMEKLEPLCIVSGNVKWCNYYGNNMVVPHKIKM